MQRIEFRKKIRRDELLWQKKRRRKDFSRRLRNRWTRVAAAVAPGKPVAQLPIHLRKRKRPHLKSKLCNEITWLLSFEYDQKSMFSELR